MGISQVKGKGYLRHNNRDFISDNIDPARIKDNIIFKQQSLQDAYNDCFGDALEDYNAKQKRQDRKINDYFTHLFGKDPNDILSSRVLRTNDTNPTKSFYEDLVQVGDKNTCGIGSDNANIAKQALIDYMQGNAALGIPSYQERNPNLKVFNAVLHMDEATPHLHIDYIPIATGYKRGLTVQNGYNRALEQMGYDGANGFKDWRAKERDVFRDICTSYGLDIKPKEQEENRGISYDVAEYKQIILQAEVDASEIRVTARKEAETMLAETQAEVNAIRMQMEQKQEQERIAKDLELISLELSMNIDEIMCEGADNNHDKE